MNITDLTAYRQEIKYLLMSMSIKYTPISDLFNEKVAALGYEVEEDDPLCWKYYLNLQGCYHPIDTMMEIRSLDTSETVPFTKETLQNHRATKNAYVPGNSFYTSLINRYPEQANLIKSIVYPVTDIEKMLEAPDLTLLQYDKNALEELEQSVLIQDLIDHLDYIRDRWYQPFLNNLEIFYPMAFWGSLWQNLAGALFTFRTSYIRTAFAHNFHIKSFLESRNVDVLKNVLTRNQVLFLYRNIDYILDNRGKHSTLEILSRNLLNENSLGLVNKTIVQNTTNSEENACRWSPEFISQIVPENNKNISIALPLDTVRTMNEKLVNAGLEKDTSDDHIANQTRQMGATVYNRLPTKVLEIRKFDQIFTKARLIWNFMMDTLVYSLIRGYHTPVHRIQDSVTGITLRLEGFDILYLLNYTVGRILNQTAETLPKQYMPVFRYKEDIKEEDIPDMFYFDGHIYPMKQFLDKSKWVRDIHYPDFPLPEASEFVNYIVGMFDRFIYQYQTNRLTSSALTQRAHHIAFDSIVDRNTLYFSENTVLYEDWIDQIQNLRTVIETYEKSDNVQSFYANFAKDLFDAMLPTTNAVSRYLDLNGEIEKNALLTDIFRQLTSYNVAFLNSSRETQIWAPLSKTSYFVNNVSYGYTDYYRNDIPILYNSYTSYYLEHNLSHINLFVNPHMSMDIDYKPLASLKWETLNDEHNLYCSFRYGIAPKHEDTSSIAYPIGASFSIDTDPA